MKIKHALVLSAFLIFQMAFAGAVLTPAAWAKDKPAAKRGVQAAGIAGQDPQDENEAKDALEAKKKKMKKLEKNLQAIERVRKIPKTSTIRVTPVLPKKTPQVPPAAKTR